MDIGTRGVVIKSMVDNQTVTQLSAKLVADMSPVTLKVSSVNIASTGWTAYVNLTLSESVSHQDVIVGSYYCIVGAP